MLAFFALGDMLTEFTGPRNFGWRRVCVMSPCTIFAPERMALLLGIRHMRACTGMLLAIW